MSTPPLFVPSEIEVGSTSQINDDILALTSVALANIPDMKDRAFAIHILLAGATFPADLCPMLAAALAHTLKFGAEATQEILNTEQKVLEFREDLKNL